MTLKNDYPKDTIGYYYICALYLFGEGTKPVKFLEKKASESSNRFDERVIMHETQMFYMLKNMWKQGRDEALK